MPVACQGCVSRHSGCLPVLLLSPKAGAGQVPSRDRSARMSSSSSVCGTEQQAGSLPAGRCTPDLCPCSLHGTAGTSLEQPRATALVGCARCLLPTNTGTRGQVPLPRLSPDHCCPQDGFKCAHATAYLHSEGLGLVPCGLGTSVPWAWPACGGKPQ